MAENSNSEEPPMKNNDDVIKNDNDGNNSDENESDHNDSISNHSSSCVKNIKEQYEDYRLTAKTLMYLIDNRDREKVSKWLKKLDGMEDEEGQLERVYYVRYLVATLSGSFGLVEPFTTPPPDTVKSLSMVLPAPVYAELLERDEDAKQRPRKTGDNKRPQESPVVQHYDHNDKLFFEQLLFPPEGLVCYAAAFSAMSDNNN